MNITESNAVSILLRALQGDRTLDPDKVCDAAMTLKARVQSALNASPDVNEGLVLANTITLQVAVGGPLFDDVVAELGPLDGPGLELIETPKVKDPERAAAERQKRVEAQPGYAKAQADKVSV